MFCFPWLNPGDSDIGNPEVREGLHWHIRKKVHGISSCDMCFCFQGFLAEKWFQSPNSVRNFVSKKPYIMTFEYTSWLIGILWINGLCLHYTTKIYQNSIIPFVQQIIRANWSCFSLSQGIFGLKKWFQSPNSVRNFVSQKILDDIPVYRLVERDRLNEWLILYNQDMIGQIISLSTANKQGQMVTAHVTLCSLSLLIAYQVVNSLQLEPVMIRYDC